MRVNLSDEEREVLMDALEEARDHWYEVMASREVHYLEEDKERALRAITVAGDILGRL